MNSPNTRSLSAPRLRRVSMRVAQDVLELMLRPGGFGLGAVLGHVQPALDQVFVRLEMELQSVRAIAIAKRLVGAGGRAGEMHGARRQIEGVGMPLEHVLAAVEVPAQRVGLRRGAWDAAGTSRSRARCAGRTLAPSAAASNCAPRQMPRTGMPRSSASWMAAISVVRCGKRSAWSTFIGPPSTIEAVVAADVGLQLGLAREIDVADAEAGRRSIGSSRPSGSRAECWKTRSLRTGAET